MVPVDVQSTCMTHSIARSRFVAHFKAIAEVKAHILSSFLRIHAMFQLQAAPHTPPCCHFAHHAAVACDLRSLMSQGLLHTTALRPGVTMCDQVLEASGVADAGALAAALAAAGFRLDCVVAVVDADAGLASLKHPVAESQASFGWRFVGPQSCSVWLVGQVVEWVREVPRVS